MHYAVCWFLSIYIEFMVMRICHSRGVDIRLLFVVAFSVAILIIPCKLYIPLELHSIALWYESFVLLNRYCVGQVIFS